MHDYYIVVSMPCTCECALMYMYIICCTLMENACYIASSGFGDMGAFE